MSRKTTPIEVIDLKLDKPKSEVLARFLALLQINFQINPQSYDRQTTRELIEILDQLDYLMHEVANFCDRGSSCSYWKKKLAKQKRND